jgi:hypothetical protein
VALVICGIPRLDPAAALLAHHEGRAAPTRRSIGRASVIVAAILIAAIPHNVTINLRFKDLADHFPFIGVSVWVVILLATPLRKPQWDQSCPKRSRAASSCSRSSPARR